MLQGLGGDVGDQFGVGWCVELVGYDFEFVVLFGQVQYGFGEVFVVCGVDLVGVEDQVVVVVGVDGLFVFQFGLFVDVQWVGWCVFGERCVVCVVEYVVGGVMYQLGVVGCGFFGQYCDGVGIDQVGVVGIVFGFVYCGVGVGVDDELWLFGVNQLCQVFGVGEIGVLVVIDQQFVQWCQGVLQFLVDLVVGVEEKDLVYVYCLFIYLWQVLLVMLVIQFWLFRYQCMVLWMLVLKVFVGFQFSLCFRCVVSMVQW